MAPSLWARFEYDWAREYTIYAWRPDWNRDLDSRSCLLVRLPIRDWVAMGNSLGNVMSSRAVRDLPLRRRRQSNTAANDRRAYLLRRKKADEKKAVDDGVRYILQWADLLIEVLILAGDPNAIWRQTNGPLDERLLRTEILSAIIINRNRNSYCNT